MDMGLWILDLRLYPQRVGNLIALLQRLWIKTEKPSLEMKAIRAAGGL